MGFAFTPEGVIAVLVSAWATGLMLGGVTALLSALTSRGR